jgi:antitoxin (DNA-binding transcriptional repressor) of toxin-antitoxin stability system
MYHMKRATVRDLRYAFPKVEAELAEGEEIEIVKRGKVVARLVPARRIEQPRAVPDFLARLQETWGSQLLEPSNADLLSEGRERF